MHFCRYQPGTQTIDKWYSACMAKLEGLCTGAGQQTVARTFLILNSNSKSGRFIDRVTEAEMRDRLPTEPGSVVVIGNTAAS